VQRLELVFDLGPGLAADLRDFKGTDADSFFRDVARVLSKASLIKIKSTLVSRSGGRRSTIS
jgi:hypothetical protein